MVSLDAGCFSRNGGYRSVITNLAPVFKPLEKPEWKTAADFPMALAAAAAASASAAVVVAE